MQRCWPTYVLECVRKQQKAYYPNEHGHRAASHPNPTHILRRQIHRSLYWHYGIHGGLVDDPMRLDASIPLRACDEFNKHRMLSVEWCVVELCNTLQCFLVGIEPRDGKPSGPLSCKIKDFCWEDSP